MRDGPIRACIKAIVRAAWALELGVRRGFVRLRKAPRYRLGGACGGCAKCCEQPTIRVGVATLRLGLLRRLFLGWQRVVNGFEWVATDEDAQTFAFRCTHFNHVTRRCDSYATRPFLCRDYPRALLDQAWPELFPGCGFRAVAPNAQAMREALARSGLPEEKQAELARRMHLRE